MEDVVIKIRSDISDLQTDLNKVKGLMAGVDNTVDKLDKSIDNAFDGKAIKRGEQQVRKFASAADKAGRTVESKMGGAFRRLGASIIAAFSISAVTNFMKSSIAEARMAEKTFAKLTAVIKSTGGIAGVSAKELKDMSGELMRMTGVEDDVIMNAQALLLTFTKIGKEVFPDATEAMLDMSATLGQDLGSSAIQLGKALNDPIQGVTALRRVGIQLSEDQEGQIKKFMEMNDVVSAQKIILGELKTQMGGVARAMAQTDAGKIQAVSNSFGELKEAMGARWQRDLALASEGLTTFMDNLTGLIEIKASDELKDQQENVNALAFALADGNIPLEQKRSIYQQLKVLAPDVIGDMKLETISYVDLTKNLEAYNKQMINKITLMLAYEDVQDKNDKAGEKGNDVVKKTMAVNRLSNEIIKEVNLIHKSGAADMSVFISGLKTASDNYKSGTWNASQYGLAVAGIADQVSDLGLVYKQTGEEIIKSTDVTNLRVYSSGLTRSYGEQRDATNEATGAMKNYVEVQNMLGISMETAMETLTGSKDGNGDAGLKGATEDTKTAYELLSEQISTLETKLQTQATVTGELNERDVQQLLLLKDKREAIDKIIESLEQYNQEIIKISTADFGSEEEGERWKKQMEENAKATQEFNEEIEEMVAQVGLRVPMGYSEAIAAMSSDNWDAELEKIGENWQGILDQSVGLLTESLTSENQEITRLLEERVNSISSSIDKMEEELDREIQLNQQGFASNVELKRMELNALKAEEEKAIAARDEQIEKQRKQARTAAQISAAAATVKLLADAVEISGIAGIILGGLAVASFLSLLSSGQNEASGSVKFAHGDAQILGGRSHAGGGVSLGNYGEAEKGEFLGILSSKTTRKFGKPMLSLFDGINSNNDAKITAGLLGIAGLSAPDATTGQGSVELKEVKEIRGMYDIMRRPTKTVINENGKRIERTGTYTRVVYVN